MRKEVNEMPKTTYGECTFCGSGKDPDEGLAPGQSVYIYMDGTIRRVGFVCSHCITHYSLR